eukprot:1613834-Pyramimonas_sp.AAC.1
MPSTSRTCYRGGTRPWQECMGISRTVRAEIARVQAVLARLYFAQAAGVRAPGFECQDLGNKCC